MGNHNGDGGPAEDAVPEEGAPRGEAPGGADPEGGAAGGHEDAPAAGDPPAGPRGSRISKGKPGEDTPPGGGGAAGGEGSGGGGGSDEGPRDDAPPPVRIPAARPPGDDAPAAAADPREHASSRPFPLPRQRTDEPAHVELPPLSGRYRLGDVVGRGGMGTVWRATDEVLGREVAVKELRLPPGIDDTERQRLITRTLREAKAIAAIRGRGVVTIYDVVDEGSRPWIVMELIEGRSLAEIIRDDGPLSPRRTAGIGLDVLDVLTAAHRRGILHRDVKPSNVLIAEADGRVVLTDFGIAKVEGDPSITSTGMLVGAPSYISPERARGETVGPAADFWSLGALLYCAVEGRPPYDRGGPIATLAAVMNDPVEPPAHAGPLGAAITAMLVKDPRQRADAGHFGRLLRAALEDPRPPEEADGRDSPPVVTRRHREEPGTPAGSGAPGPPPAESAPDAAPTAALAEQPASGNGGRFRRVLLVGVAVVVLALLGAVVASRLDADGERPGADGPTSAAPTGTDGSAADPAADPAGEPSGEESGEPSDGATGESEAGGDPPATEPGHDADNPLPATNPPGFTRQVNAEFRFSIAVPPGWEQTGRSGPSGTSGAVYSAPGGGPPRIQVDFTDSPTASAELAWQALEPVVRDSSVDYRHIGLSTVGWRGYPTVADWEFERTEDGHRVRVLDRGFQVDAGRGYAIMITCVADEWDGNECRTLRETAFASFEPLA